MSENTANIQKRLSDARKCNHHFDRFVSICDAEIERFVEKINLENDTPTINLKSKRVPSETLVRILLPVVPISPNELSLLVEYLEDKYLDDDERIVGGDYFEIHKCLFRNNFKLSTYRYHYYDI